MRQRIGKQTIQLQNPVSILETASIVGKKEGDAQNTEYKKNRQI